MIGDSDTRNKATTPTTDSSKQQTESESGVYEKCGSWRLVSLGAFSSSGA